MRDGDKNDIPWYLKKLWTSYDKTRWMSWLGDKNKLIWFRLRSGLSVAYIMSTVQPGEGMFSPECRSSFPKCHSTSDCSLLLLFWLIILLLYIYTPCRFLWNTTVCTGHSAYCKMRCISFKAFIVYLNFSEWKGHQCVMTNLRKFNMFPTLKWDNCY